MKLTLVALATLVLAANGTDPNYRLNTPIVPAWYSIALTPYFDTGDATAFTFDGEVNIQFTTNNRTSQIKLHSDDLTFTAANITVTNNASTIGLSAVSPLEFDTNYTFALINLASDLETGVTYNLRIVYKGKIRDDLKGFYRNYYMENGVKKWLGATQMEPTHARKAFPCFDEPSLKAVFTLIIDRPESYKPSLANTKMASSVPLSNGYVRETFHPTPRMSTYLVAFIVSELEAAHTNLSNTREFGIYTRPQAANQSDFAFDFGLKVVQALSDYFQIDYYSVDSNLKLDHVALPDFNAGAMENWGLVNYRESLMLYVPEDSLPHYKYRVAQIFAHETTHMWFGNLVTCHWWSDTWLNEGFANYFQDYITERVDPEVGAGNMLVIGSVYAAYDADNTPGAVPISNNNVNSPAEISAHFGTITYQKAGSVIRMMHHLVGDDAFVKGLNAYLTTNSLNSGYPEKLYSGLNEGITYYNNTLSAYSSASIFDIMSSWITQAGHPIVTVNIDYETGAVTLTQKRFHIDAAQSSNETYKIPITYTTEVSPNFTYTKPAFIMENETQQLMLSDITENHSWVLLNLQETGLYRVNYDNHAWQIISSAMKDLDKREKIHHLNRAKIINDLFALFYADEVKFEVLYDMLKSMTSETDYSVWYAAIRGLNKMWHNFLGSDSLADLQVAALEIIEYGIKTLGYEVKSTDSIETLKNRQQLLEFACKLGHQGCLDFSVNLFKDLRQNAVEISPSFRPVAYCYGLRSGTGDDYEFLWSRMSTTNVANEARTIGEVLGCTNDEASLRRYLVSMLDENSPIKTQDLTVPLTSVLANYDNLHIVMDGLKQNYTLWSSIYPSMETILGSVAAALHTESDFNEFESWLASCTECTSQVKSSAQTALTSAKASTTWAQNHKEDILKSLRNLSSVLSPSVATLIAGCIALLINL